MAYVKTYDAARRVWIIAHPNLDFHAGDFDMTGRFRCWKEEARTWRYGRGYNEFRSREAAQAVLDANPALKRIGGYVQPLDVYETRLSPQEASA